MFKPYFLFLSLFIYSIFVNAKPLSPEEELYNIQKERMIEIKNEKKEIEQNINDLEILKKNYLNEIEETNIKIINYIQEINFLRLEISKEDEYFILNNQTKHDIIIFDLADNSSIKLIKYNLKETDNLKNITERTYDLNDSNNFQDLESRIESIKKINNLSLDTNNYNIDNLNVLYIPFFK